MTVRRNILLLAILSSAAFVPGTAKALTFIDFEGFPSSTNVVGDPNNPASVISNQLAGQGVVFGRTGLSTGIAVIDDGSSAACPGLCAAGLNAAGEIPFVLTGDIFFGFVDGGQDATADFVSFIIGDGGGDTDFFTIRSFDLANNLIGSQNVSGVSRFPVTINTPGVHRVEIDFDIDQSPLKSGYYFDDLEFRVNRNGPTSVPGPLPVLGAAAAFGFSRKLRNRIRRSENG